MPEDFASRVAGIGALAEPVRRELYLYVVAQAVPVSRDQVAAGTGVPRHAVKFHLDRLVGQGLLETEFRRLSGRRGPGAGRPAKLYRRAAREVTVTLPERRYDLAGQILAEAVEEAAGADQRVLRAVGRSAAAAGRRIGAVARAAAAIDPDVPPLTSIAAVLAGQGYEPRVEPRGAPGARADRVVLANCPFHALAERHLELVCGMNLELITALTEELGHPDVEVRLDAAPGRCCVTLSQRGGAGRAGSLVPERSDNPDTDQGGRAMTSGTEDRGHGPAVPDRPITPPRHEEDVIEPIEATQEYAAAAEDDVTLAALGEEPTPRASQLSGRPASEEPSKGPE